VQPALSVYTVVSNYDLLELVVVGTCAVCVLAELKHQLADSSQECLRIKVREHDRIF